MVAQGFRIWGVLFRECAQIPTFLPMDFVLVVSCLRGEVCFESSLGVFLVLRFWARTWQDSNIEESN